MNTRLPLLEIGAKLSPTEPIFYGTDRGFTDRDLGKNDDQNAITGKSPLFPREYLDTPIEEIDLESFPIEFGFGIETSDVSNEVGSYYAKPISIYIPRSLEPLPEK